MSQHILTQGLIVVCSLVLMKWIFKTSVLILTYIISLLSKIKLKNEKPILGQINNKESMEINNIKFKLLLWSTGIVKYGAFIINEIPSYYIRRVGCKYILKLNLAEKVVIAKNIEIRSGHKISIGKNSIIGDKCILDGRSGITIGENVNLSSEVRIWTMQHNLNDEHFSVVGKAKPVFVGDRVWLSSNVTILPGVKIGEGAVIASGAVVTKDVEPFSIYAGIPAKKIGERNKNIKYYFTGITPFFE